MTYIRKFLLALLILGFLCSCTQTPKQITEKVRKATVKLVDEKKRGLVYQKTGQQKKAEADFQKAKEFDPDVRK